MAIIDYILDEKVAVVTMNHGENMFNIKFLEGFLTILDEIENETEANALIVTSAHEKVFSAGIDMNWLDPFIKKKDKGITSAFFHAMNRLFKRILLYPMTTIAAISGHAFAAGAVMCCAFDFRFMRSDRGYFCFPEIDLGMPFFPGSIALIKKGVPMYMFEKLVYTGKRAKAEDLEEHQIVLKACHMADLMKEALSFAKSLDKRREIIAEMKKRMYKDIVHIIDVEDSPMIESGFYNV